MKKITAACGAAFLLLTVFLLLPATRARATTTYNSFVNMWLQNSKIDSTPIGLSIQSTGQFTNLYSNGGAVNAVIGNNTPNVATFTTITGTSFSGNSSTATAFAATPSQCSSGGVATGIQANGTANCTAKGAVTGTEVYLANQSLCTPGTSTDAQCSGSIGPYTNLGDTNYTVSATTFDSSGANLVFTMTSKTATGFNYVLTCTFNCGTYGGPEADIRVFHP